ncbi:hypothetical protein N7532_007491 [Penicillium argentinense]|uniref:Signal transduction histidine kinase dimerisation/phosphoacceptor domain-containing protein n=1 Tax=Penicillium argentinense TaxID=1131581 RepID=A0A9W9F806_9EURO|nr:uncharacterized protein N7532_007491 [Penicillium argentinense]KAJ5095200.1 hypothetical protein N7532_007491 [Penicillium argentinense]
MYTSLQALERTRGKQTTYNPWNQKFISHELRSPLHGILRRSQLVHDMQLNSLQRGVLPTIESCGQTLLTITSSIIF